MWKTTPRLPCSDIGPCRALWAGISSSVGILLLLLGLAGPVRALTPPTPEQVAQYQRDGSLAERIANARRLGNHLADPWRVWDMRRRLEALIREARGGPPVGPFRTPPPDWQGGLPSSGTPKVLVLLVDFSDYPHSSGQTPADVAAKFFADGDPTDAPYESLRNFYQRSSYGQLTLTGNVLGWYRAQQTRSYYQNLGWGRGQETLIWRPSTTTTATTSPSTTTTRGHRCPLPQVDRPGQRLGRILVVLPVVLVVLPHLHRGWQVSGQIRLVLVFLPPGRGLPSLGRYP